MAREFYIVLTVSVNLVLRSLKVKLNQLMYQQTSVQLREAHSFKDPYEIFVKNYNIGKDSTITLIPTTDSNRPHYDMIIENCKFSKEEWEGIKFEIDCKDVKKPVLICKNSNRPDVVVSRSLMKREFNGVRKTVWNCSVGNWKDCMIQFWRKPKYETKYPVLIDLQINTPANTAPYLFILELEVVKPIVEVDSTQGQSQDLKTKETDKEEVKEEAKEEITEETTTEETTTEEETTEEEIEEEKEERETENDDLIFTNEANATEVSLDTNTTPSSSTTPSSTTRKNSIMIIIDAENASELPAELTTKKQNVREDNSEMRGLEEQSASVVETNINEALPTFAANSQASTPWMTHNHKEEKSVVQVVWKKKRNKQQQQQPEEEKEDGKTVVAVVWKKNNNKEIQEKKKQDKDRKGTKNDLVLGKQRDFRRRF